MPVQMSELGRRGREGWAALGPDAAHDEALLIVAAGPGPWLGSPTIGGPRRRSRATGGTRLPAASADAEHLHEHVTVDHVAGVSPALTVLNHVAVVVEEAEIGDHVAVVGLVPQLGEHVVEACAGGARHPRPSGSAGRGPPTVGSCGRGVGSRAGIAAGAGPVGDEELVAAGPAVAAEDLEEAELSSRLGR